MTHNYSVHCNCTRYARTHGKLDSHVCTSGIRRKTTSAYWSTGSSVDANTFMLCLWSRGLILCQIRRRWVDDCGWIHASFVPRGCPFPGCRLIDAWRYVDLTGHHKSISTFVRLNTGINAHAQTHERVADTAAHTQRHNHTLRTPHTQQIKSVTTWGMSVSETYISTTASTSTRISSSVPSEVNARKYLFLLIIHHLVPRTVSAR